MPLIRDALDAKTQIIKLKGWKKIFHANRLPKGSQATYTITRQTDFT